MTSATTFREIALCALWRDQAFEQPPCTVDGRPIEVVNRGVWTHGFGPDFRDAMILFDERDLQCGSIELHHRTSGWHHHGHYADPRYDDVILHVVHTHDGRETRRHDGRLVPVLELGSSISHLTTTAATGPDDWSRFGGPACAPELAASRPDVISGILHHLGDARLAMKAASIEALLTVMTPSEALYQKLCDGLGYRDNRAPMISLARHIPLSSLEALLAVHVRERRRNVAMGVLFGAAGFCPLSPSDAHLGQISPEDVRPIEQAWMHRGTPWHDQAMAPTAWTRARVRPANHPAARLAALATILVNAVDRGGLVAALLAPLYEGNDPIQTLRDLAMADRPMLGSDRAGTIVANALVPFAVALAEHTSDTTLLDAASSTWERLPAGGANEVLRRTGRQVAGKTTLRRLGARGQQGLIHLDSTLCAPRRCYECPIAHRVLAEK
jgi:hypothetical protein